MQCSDVAPLVSILHDEEISLDTLRHISDCSACQTRLLDYSAIATGMRATAAKSQSDMVVHIPRVGRRWTGLAALTRTVAIPRVVAGLVGLVVVFASLGWIRIAAQERVTPRFVFKVTYPSEGIEAPTQVLTEGSYGGTEVNRAAPDGGYRPLAYRIEVTSIRDDRVLLNIRIKHFGESREPLDSQVAGNALYELGLRTITYIPGTKMSLPIVDGEEAILTGTIVYQRENAAPLEGCPTR